MDISGKTVLVTGAAGGIGGALVRELLANNAAHIYACDLSPDSVNELDFAKSQRVTACPLDVTDESAVELVAKELTGTEILINCHGIVVHENFLDAKDVSAFRREMEVNYWGQVLMCRAFSPVLGLNGGGAIVKFLSPLAYITYPFCASYCASKAACRVLLDSLRAELAHQNTFLMGVCPGVIDTGMMKNMDMPKSPPELVAAAVVRGIEKEEDEIWPGPDAEDLRRRFRQDPDEVTKEAAAYVRV